MADYEFEATPTVQQNGGVSWELCYMNPPGGGAKECGDGTPTSPYPNVEVPKGNANQSFHFKIVGNSQITFAPDSTPTKPGGPIWAHEKGKTMGPGVNSQLKDVEGAKKQELKLVDKNNNKDEMTIHYQLNFVGPGDTQSVIDPDIKNGGKPSFHTTYTAAMVIGAAVLVALVVLVVRNFRGRESGPSDINRGA